MNENKVIKWIVYSETMENLTGTLYDSCTKKSARVTPEGSLTDNEDTFTLNLV